MRVSVRVYFARARVRVFYCVCCGSGKRYKVKDLILNINMLQDVQEFYDCEYERCWMRHMTVRVGAQLARSIAGNTGQHRAAVGLPVGVRSDGHC